MVSKLFAVTLAATLVSAQTSTLCDPTKKDCPNPKALGAKIVDIDFRKGDDDHKFLKVLAGTTLDYDEKLGAVYTITKDTDAPTTQSDPYIFFGQVDVTVRAAKGAGIVTSVVLQSDDLDEIDWEWVGSDTTQVQTNYFSKGCIETYNRGGFSPVSNPESEFHTYTIKWTAERLDWIIDGTIVRTLLASEASGCSGFPQSPMQVKLGTWVAGRKGASPGTIEWAGGLANFADAPFVGYYQSLKVQDFMGGKGAKSAKEYQYTDRSGSWQSIKVIADDGSTVEDDTTTSSTTSQTKTSNSTGTTDTLSTTPSGTPTNGFTTVTSGSPTGTGNTGSAARTSSGPTAAPTSAASKLISSFGSVVAIGAALFLGTLAL
ncbi:concanavalin A-like lectin/glucanase domain-containing protein [Lasiosphaeris hirsuta]|uniref:Crh-like protein n=1 Tax=Lasiosphaeris hirsuta TaxID=260670 RepID=A0AA40A1H8_9PEZI|nr:concanavalin A-like lectin/glucanase domain-containing protein [Lasiosphaeris hirsuta]